VPLDQESDEEEKGNKTNRIGQLVRIQKFLDEFEYIDICQTNIKYSGK
jgi:hypothetical protein